MGQRCTRPTKPEIFPRGPLTEPGGPALPRHGESDRPHPSTRTVLGRESNAVPNHGVTSVAWCLMRVRVSRGCCPARWDAWESSVSGGSSAGAEFRCF